MRRNILLLVALVFFLCGCGAQGGKNTLAVVSGTTTQPNTLPKAPAAAVRQANTEELSLVLPLPQNTSPSAIADELAPYLAPLTGILRTHPQTRLRITTHCALLHSPRESKERSALMARAVKHYFLTQAACKAVRIRTHPMGAEAPLYANTSAYGRRKNNRMELLLENLAKSDGSARTPPQDSAPVHTVSSLSPAPAPSGRAMPEPSRQALARVYVLHFSTGRSGLNASTLRRIKKIAAFLKNHPKVRARIMGHTDAVGSARSNQRLSYQRALKIQTALITTYGIPSARTEAVGYGEEKPVADNRTARGRKKNRRVEIRMRPYTPAVQYAGVRTSGVVPGASSPAVVASALPAPCARPPQAADTQNFRQRLERLAKAYGAREIMYSGGVRYTPLRSAARNKRYRIEISVSKCALWLYRVLPDGSKLLIRPYAVATAQKGVPYPKGLGYVTAIDYHPWWYPTARMVRRAAAKGRRLAPIPPDSRRNPMGAFKIYLSHGNNGGSFRIHGTNQPQLIGRRVSQGCIRMTNTEGLELAKTISPGTEVVVYE